MPQSSGSLLIKEKWTAKTALHIQNAAVRGTSNELMSSYLIGVE